MTNLLSNMQIYEIIGVSGFILYVANYFLLTVGKLASEQPLYYILNGFAAFFVLIGLTSSFNLASALIQVFWIAISFWGFYLRFGRRNRVSTDLLVESAVKAKAIA